MTSSYHCIILELPHSRDYRAFYWNFDEDKKLMKETIMQSSVGAAHNIGVARGFRGLSLPP